MQKERESLPDYLTSTVEMVDAAFPGGPTADDYWPLLVLLGEGLCHENLAHVVSHVFKKDFWLVANDLLGALGLEKDGIVRSPLYAGVQQRLVACGYAEWLEACD